MHGFLWILHKDHHIRDPRKAEWNDLFAFIFALPSYPLIFFGFESFGFRFWMGSGILCYGTACFLFHDVYIHLQIKILKKFSNKYLRVNVKTHLEQHNSFAQFNYGFLITPTKYYGEEFISA